MNLNIDRGTITAYPKTSIPNSKTFSNQQNV